jgi:hypothetical protein
MKNNQIFASTLDEAPSLEEQTRFNESLPSMSLEEWADMVDACLAEADRTMNQIRSQK